MCACIFLELFVQGTKRCTVQQSRHYHWVGLMLFLQVPYAFGSLVELLSTGTQAGKENSARALANATYRSDTNKTSVASIKGSLAALVRLATRGRGVDKQAASRAVAAHALANICDAHLENMQLIAGVLTFLRHVKFALHQMY